MKDAELVVRPVAQPAPTAATPAGETTRVEAPGLEIELGKWYWVNGEKKSKWLGCVTAIGSNYAEVSRPVFSGSSSVRILFSEFEEQTEYVPDAKTLLGAKVHGCREEVKRLMNEVKVLTARLGVSPRLGIEVHEQVNTTALATLSEAPDINAYKKALIKAKEKQLPELFEQIEEAHKRLAMWMTAETLPLKALTGDLQESLEKIEDRIFNVSLYAGLTEETVLVRKGKPASFDEKLHLMQRMHYMDEESLLDYKVGGIRFSKIGDFDRWIAKKSNMTRLMPFPRCMIAMKVRRSRSQATSMCDTMLDAFISISMDQKDELTFLYIRNGASLYRMGCDLEFGEWLFPSKSGFDATQPTMANISRGGRKDGGPEFITVAEFETLSKERTDHLRAREQWFKDNPKKKWIRDWLKANPKERVDSYGRKVRRSTQQHWGESAYERENPFKKYGWSSSRDFNPDEWEPFDQTSVHYDECVERVANEAKEYNRIALIIQGLFDRSKVLHPHPPVKTWTAEGFAAAIELVRDGDGVLYDGEPPSFEAFHAKCNASIDVSSVLLGQDLVWQRTEAKKETARRRGDWRISGEVRDIKLFKPFGNPGPGELARPAKIMKRGKKAVFTWAKERLKRARSWGASPRIAQSITVPFDRLFNVSGYTPGDYLQFFRDPRTRAEYMKWAPLLLTAEEFHAGKMQVREPMQE